MPLVHWAIYLNMSPSLVWHGPYGINSCPLFLHVMSIWDLLYTRSPSLGHLQYILFAYWPTVSGEEILFSLALVCLRGDTFCCWPTGCERRYPPLSGLLLRGGTLRLLAFCCERRRHTLCLLAYSAWRGYTLCFIAFSAWREDSLCLLAYSAWRGDSLYFLLYCAWEEISLLAGLLGVREDTLRLLV
jgi:hypothetical protein